MKSSPHHISALVIDDEPLAREGLIAVLAEERDIVIAGEADDGEAAVKKILRLRPDVVFLDIQMPGLNGFEVIARIPADRIPLIVFVTAYDEFALTAFTANALDYILKPLDEDRIRSSVRRVREMVRLKESSSYSRRIQEMIASFQSQPKYLQRIPIRAAGKIQFVNADDILWIEADADYLHLHTVGGKHTMRETMNAMEKQLDPAVFVRIHRSVIVRLDAIKEMQPMHHGEFIALLIGGAKVTVSRTYKKNLRNLDL